MSISSRLLNKTAKVFEKQPGPPNEFGEDTYTIVEKISELKLAFQSQREELQFTTAGLTYTSRMAAYCDYRTDINPNDLLEVDGQRYLILSVEDDGGRGHHLRMFVSRT